MLKEFELSQNESSFDCIPEMPDIVEEPKVPKIR